MNDQELNQSHYVKNQYRTQDNLAVRIRTHQLYSELDVEFEEWILDHIPWRGDEQVLDVGCGTGAYAVAVQARAARYVAGDLSPGMVAGLPATVGERVNLSVTALPFPAAAFDVVLANHMLYHVADKRAALTGIRRVLRPGGVLLAATNSADNQAVLYDLLDTVFAAMGLPERRTPRNLLDFTLENGAAQLAPYFDEVTRHDLPDAFIFSEPEPVLAYVTSMWEARTGFTRGGAEIDAFMATAGDLLADHIRRHGPLRVPKLAGVFVCRNSSSSENPGV